MNPSDEEMELLKTMAAAMMTLDEICRALEWNVDDFKAEMANRDSVIYKAYWAAFLKQKAALHKVIFEHAESGSSPAQTMAERILKQKLTEDELF